MQAYARQDSQAIFRQLGEVKEPEAVHTLIENHDAALHNEITLIQLSTTVRTRLGTQSRDPELTARIARNRAALRPLIINLSRAQLQAG